jgi:hypothetical protein
MQLRSTRSQNFQPPPPPPLFQLSPSAVRCPSYSSILDSLPMELFHVILCFLTNADIRNFDSSITNSHLREVYLSNLRRYQMPLNKVPLNERMSTWIVLRGVIVKTLTFAEFGESGIQLVTKLSSHLVSLNFDSCRNMTSDLLRRIGKCPNLSVVGLACCPLAKKPLTRFLSSNPQIKSLNISGSKSSAASIPIIISKCKQLENLNLSCCTWMNEEALTTLIESRLDLKSFSFGFTFILNDQLILKLPNAFPNLQILNYELEDFSLETNALIFRSITLP